MADYITVFGEYYLRENDAVLAAVRLAAVNPGCNYAVRYDCVEALYRVVLVVNKSCGPATRTQRRAENEEQ